MNTLGKEKNSGLYQSGQEINIPEPVFFCTSQISIENSKKRIVFMSFFLLLAFIMIAVRMLFLKIDIIFEKKIDNPIYQSTFFLAPKMKRNNIYDRNNNLLATNIESANLIVNAPKIKDPKKIATLLVETFPDLNYKEIIEKIKKNKVFTAKKSLIPREIYDVNHLGDPNLSIEKSEIRFYPKGDLAPHILGQSDIDGNGISGVEKFFNKEIQKNSIQLSLDSNIQFHIKYILEKNLKKYSAKGAVAVLMKAKTGEVISLVSLPDFDGNKREFSNKQFNQATNGVYQIGSILKLITIATALDTKKIRISDSFDTRKTIHLANYKISDEKDHQGILQVSDILKYSSNVGTIQIFERFGKDIQYEYFKRFGLMSPSDIELPEIGKPILPKKSNDISSANMSYGYGISISPLQIVTAAAAIVNGGIYNPPTLLAKKNNENSGIRILNKKTSDQMRALMRLVVQEGTGRRASVQNYEVGGKTGSAQIYDSKKKSYQKNKINTSFLSAFPMDDPQYVLYVLMIEPQSIEKDSNLINAAWNVVPISKEIIEIIAPQLGILPRPYDEKSRAPYVKSALN